MQEYFYQVVDVKYEENIREYTMPSVFFTALYETRFTYYSLMANSANHESL